MALETNNMRNDREAQRLVEMYVKGSFNLETTGVFGDIPRVPGTNQPFQVETEALFNLTY